MATNIQLSQFPNRAGVRLSVKRSKGLEKSLRFGAVTYTSDKLAIVCKPLERCNRFIIYQGRNDSCIRLIEDLKGELELHINDDITLTGELLEPEDSDYLKVSNVNGVYYVKVSRVRKD